MKNGILVTSLVLALSGCRRAGPEVPPAPESHPGHGAAEAAARSGAGRADVSPLAATAASIRTAKPRRGSAPTAVRAPALVRWDPLAITRIITRTPGQVRQLDLPREGEGVKVGQVVAWLDSPEARALFAELGVAKELGSPWREAARDRLIASGIEQALVDEVLESGRPPDLLAVRSPVAGIVVERSAGIGSWLTSGASLATIAADGSLVAEAIVAAPAPRRGDDLALVDAATGERWPARVTAELPTGGVAGSVVRLIVEGSPALGRPYLLEWTTTAEDGLWVPRSAVVDTGERRVVFVAREGGFDARVVGIGRRSTDEIEILSGLGETDDVVVAGTFLIDSETQIGGSGHGAHP